MIYVHPHSLWLGNAGDCLNPRAVIEAGVQAVVQLASEEPPQVFPREMIQLRFPLHDGTGNSSELLRLVVFSMECLLRAAIPTLLCCSAGMSRSPAIAACAIAKLTDQSPDAILRELQTLKPIDVSPGLWLQLLDVYNR
jgi:protein-tyrosine phosphatase